MAIKGITVCGTYFCVGLFFSASEVDACVNIFAVPFPFTCHAWKVFNFVFILG